MKELNDDEFDKVFRTRITDEIPEFEAESWLKMEKKLRKRDRRVFYLNASILLLLLSFGFGFYFLNKNQSIKDNAVAGKKENKKDSQPPNKEKFPVPTSTGVVAAPYAVPSTTVAESKPKTTNDRSFNLNSAVKTPFPIATIPLSSNQQTVRNETSQSINNKEQDATQQSVPPTENIKAVESRTETTPPIIAQIDPDKIEESTKKEKKQKVKHKMPIILAINVGPDFNSTTTLIGGKAQVAFGIGLELGITKKLSLQTGLNYGRKDYSSTSTDNLYYNNYSKSIPVDISAQCKVLEIPLRASLNVSDTKKSAISINAGLSSYIMLREKYTFNYGPTLQANNKLMDIRNGGQHILSVIDLSATYNIKLQNKKLALGLEPYIKVPLTGIGENSVPLKSSGISLKLSYDFSKKH